LPSRGGTSAFTRSFRSAADECAAAARSWLPGSSGRDVAEETTGSPKVPGESRLSVCHVQSTPAGLRAPDQYGAAAWPLVSEQQGLPRLVFRRSIAWPSDSLSTLRGAGYPNPTQDALPAAGQALPDGLSTRRTPSRGFRVLLTSQSSSPKLLGASRVALAITRQGSHRSVRARIRAYGSSTSRVAARKGPRSYSIELRGHGLEPRGVPHVALDRVCWLTLRFPPQGPPG